jgi:hypothetical protein
MWYFYVGARVVVHAITPEGNYLSILLGNDPAAGEVLQAVVKAGCWFASHVADWKSFAVVGCTVAPGFDFEDFEMGRREELVRAYLQHRGTIERLTRG